MTRSEYALYLLPIATKLKDSREESEIISQISMHFEKEVRGTIRGLGTKNKRNLLLTLTDFDNEDTQKRIRNGTHETQDKPSGSFGQNQKQPLNSQYNNKPNYKKEIMITTNKDHRTTRTIDIKIESESNLQRHKRTK